MKMLKKLLAVLLVVTAVSGCQKKQEIPVEKISSAITTDLGNGSFITAFTVMDHDIYVYQPSDIMHGDVINYGYSAPLLLVFSEGKRDQQEAVSFICEKGIDKVAQKNGGAVVFINPLDKWSNEKEGIYEAIMAQTAVGQTGFSHGMIYDAANRQYHIFASVALTCLYGYGQGADYIAKYCLKKMEGTSSMSSLGSSDITPTAAILENLKKKADVSEKEIIVCEPGDNESFESVYDEKVAGHQRWNGKLTETFNLEKEGLEMTPLVLEVTTSPDNREVRTERHEVGVVIYKLKNNDKPKPLVLCFHGGGDTAITTATIAGWPLLAAREDFILCAIEMHTRVTATETIEIIEKLRQIYSIDSARIYATGFSMGGIKTWDLYQEYPEVFAALAPMGASVAVGKNTQFSDAPRCNEEVMVPLFYSGGENSQLEELPFQGLTVINRINYLFKVNGISADYVLSMNNKAEWTDSVFGYEGDIVDKLTDESYPDSVTTIRYYRSNDGNIYTALCSIKNHQHEIRPFTCQKAWEFMKRFSREKEIIVISD